MTKIADLLFVRPLRAVLIEIAGHDCVEYPLQCATFRVHGAKPVPLPFRQIFRAGNRRNI